MISDDILNILCSSKKIERDNGAVNFHKLLLSGDNDIRICLETKIIELLTTSENTPWETKHGCLLGAKEIIHRIDTNNCDKDLDFLKEIRNVARKLLTDIEVRVRLESGEVFGALCEKVGPAIYEEEKEFILNLIVVNLERQITEDDSTRIEQLESEKLVEKLVGEGRRRNSADAAQIFHDTAGWKNLETSLKCFQAMVLGCGVKFQAYVNHELLSLLFRTLTHTNRFVRETGYYVCSALVKCGKADEDEDCEVMSESNPIFVFGHEFSKQLALGLADNWSQVRLAASDATRSFLLALPPDTRETFYPQLLPQMCLNRYYVAEGVRIYSQETWRQVMGSGGRSMVQRYIEPTVAYYRAATLADNHAVREAACACIAELATKLEDSAVRPYVPILLDTLLACFRDDSWPVRDAACLASGHFILCFKEESSSAMETLYPLFFQNLGDPIASVRQGAAASLANVVRAYGPPSLQIILEKVKSYLKGIKDQPAEVDRYKEEVGCDRQATFGLIKRQRDNDMDLHTDQQMYSCGSLAPKMGRGGGGCSNHKFNRPSQPWEKADGSVYLLCELSSVPEASKEVLRLLPMLADACQHQHYPQHIVFLETLCKQLPLFAKNLGVRPFKAYLDYFLDPIFRSIESENALTSSAASQCLNQLSSLVGPNILRARVSNHNPRFLDRLDANNFIAPL